MGLTTGGDYRREISVGTEFVFRRSSRLTAIDLMISYIHAPYDVAFDIKRGSQIASNLHSMNRFAVDGRELVNLVRPEARIEGILLENLKCSCRQSLLLRSQFR